MKYQEYENGHPVYYWSLSGNRHATEREARQDDERYMTSQSWIAIPAIALIAAAIFFTLTRSLQFTVIIGVLGLIIGILICWADTARMRRDSYSGGRGGG